MNANSHSHSDLPLVSVGVPVWNAGKLIGEAIESVLAQSYPNIELIISDNASTDDTGAICQEYAAKDPRVRYHRNATNIGAHRNFLRLIDLAGGKFFTWLASDDLLLEKDSLAAIVDYMQSHGDVVLCGSAIRHLDLDGPGTVTPQSFPEIHPDVPWGKARLEFFRWPFPAVTYAMYGVYELNALKRLLPIPFLETPLLMRLSALGRIVALPRILRAYRHHPAAGNLEIRNKSSLVGLFFVEVKVRLIILKNALVLPAPWREKCSIITLALKTLIDPDIRWPSDYRVMAAQLRKEKAILVQARRERMALLERLRPEVGLHASEPEKSGEDDGTGFGSSVRISGFRRFGNAIADWFTRMFMHPPERDKEEHRMLHEEVVRLRQRCKELLDQINDLTAQIEKQRLSEHSPSS